MDDIPSTHFYPTSTYSDISPKQTGHSPLHVVDPSMASSLGRESRQCRFVLIGFGLEQILYVRVVNFMLWVDCALCGDKDCVDISAHFL